MTYYKEKRFSASMLSKIEFFIKNEIPFEKFQYDENPTTKSKDLGSLIHLALETDGKIFDKFITLDESIIKLTSKEKEFYDKGANLSAYFKVYDNKNSRKLKEEYEKIVIDHNEKEIEEKLSSYKEYNDYKELLNKIERYTDSVNQIALKKEEGFIVLDEFDSKPFEFSNKIKESYFTAISNKDYQNLFLFSKDTEVKVFSELELKYEVFDELMKSKLDKLIINYTDKKIIHIDFKTHSRSALVNFKSYNTARQLSIYETAIAKNKELLNIDDSFSIDHYILFIDIENMQCKLEAIARNTIDAGLNGGFYKTTVYDHYNELDELDVFLTPNQLQHLFFIEAINPNTKKQKHALYAFGFLELLNYIKTNNLYEKIFNQSDIDTESNNMFNL